MATAIQDALLRLAGWARRAHPRGARFWQVGRPPLRWQSDGTLQLAAATGRAGDPRAGEPGVRGRGAWLGHPRLTERGYGRIRLDLDQPDHRPAWTGPPRAGRGGAARARHRPGAEGSDDRRLQGPRAVE